jgi:hypothetical protein
MSVHELRLGCYRDKANEDSNWFRFRWMINIVHSKLVGIAPLADGTFDAGDLRPSGPSDWFRLTLTPKGEAPDTYDIRPDNQRPFTLYGLVGDIEIVAAVPGTYSVVLEVSLPPKIPIFAKVAVQANANDTSQTICTALVNEINSKIEDVVSSLATLNSIALRPKQPAAIIKLSAQGPTPNCILTHQHNDRPIVGEAKTAHDTLVEFEKDIFPEAIVDKMKSLLIDACQSVWSGKHSQLVSIATHLARILYPVISRYYLGADTDVGIGQGGIDAQTAIPSTAFVRRIEVALVEALRVLEVATRDDEPRQVQYELLLTRIVEVLPALIVRTAADQDKLKLLATASASGMHVSVALPPAAPGSKSKFVDVPIGELLGLEYCLDAAKYTAARKTKSRTRNYKQVKAELSWFDEKGNLIASSLPTRPNENCFNNPLGETGDPPSAQFVEDATFDLLLRKVDQSTVDLSGSALTFKPTCGDGLVSVSVTNVGGHGSRYTAFVFLRTEEDIAPDLTSINPLPKAIVPYSEEQAVLAGFERSRVAPPMVLDTFGNLSLMQRVDFTEKLTVEADAPKGALIKQDAADLYGKTPDPGEPLSTLIVHNNVPPLGRLFYYWVSYKALDGTWTKPSPVARQPNAKLSLPMKYAGDGTVMPILASSQPDAPSISTDGLLAKPGAKKGWFHISVIVQNDPIKDVTGNHKVLPRYAEIYKIEQLHLVIFRRMPKVDLSEQTTRSFVVDEPDLDYYRYQPWFHQLEFDHWEFVALSVASGFNPSSDGRVEVTLVDNTGVALNLPGGWDYLGVVVAKRSSEYCYRIPPTKQEPGYDPARPNLFPVVRYQERPDGGVDRINGVEPARPYATILPLPKAGPVPTPGLDKPVTEPVDDHLPMRSVLFEYSRPAFTPPRYFQPYVVPPAPRVREGLE